MALLLSAGREFSASFGLVLPPVFVVGGVFCGQPVTSSNRRQAMIVEVVLARTVGSPKESVGAMSRRRIGLFHLVRKFAR